MIALFTDDVTLNSAASYREKMIALIPSWAHHYDEFWDAIKRRNLWLIKLRYGAVAVLGFFLLSSEFILGVKFSEGQFSALLAINVSILIYNVILQIARRRLKLVPGRFNPLHFSLLQMCLDLIALELLVYYTGSIETPLYMLFVFHMIIGSLILPGWVIYSVAAFVVISFTSIVSLEYMHIIPHQFVHGFLTAPVYDNFKFVVSFTVIFVFVMFISVMIANKIANQLYLMEQKLVESIDKLHAAEKEKQRYIIGIVHEIKTPLSAIHSYLDLLLGKFLGPLNSDVEEKLVRARKRSDEALKLVSSVLNISKLRLVSEITFEDIDIKKIIGKALKEHATDLESKCVHINIKDNRINKTALRGDEFLMEIAFSNLVGNAVKYVGDRGIIEISLEEAEKTLKINISDNGIGIPSNDIEKIFRDFYRASNIKQAGHTGTGLGLSIVKFILEKHGGSVTVNSPSHLGTKDNPGAVFNITLPLSS